MKDWIAVDNKTPEKSGAYLVVVQGLSVRFADRAFYDVETNILETPLLFIVKNMERYALDATS